MRLTVLGCGPAAPQPDTPASGLLLEASAASLLLDCGPGVAAELRARLDPQRLAAVVVSHMHADHFLDLALLRYSFPWPGTARRLPVFLPPGGLARLDTLAPVISERPGFFHDAYAIVEYDPDRPLAIADLTFRFTRARHYVPSWAMEISNAAGTRLVYTADTGPSEAIERLGAGADLLVCEATLDDPSHDDLERGHMTPGEAIDLARRTEARVSMLTHYATHRRPDLVAQADASGLAVVVATPGLEVEFARGAPAQMTKGDGRPGARIARQTRCALIDRSEGGNHQRQAVAEEPREEVDQVPSAGPPPSA